MQSLSLTEAYQHAKQEVMTSHKRVRELELYLLSTREEGEREVAKRLLVKAKGEFFRKFKEFENFKRWLREEDNDLYLR